MLLISPVTDMTLSTIPCLLTQEESLKYNVRPSLLQLKEEVTLSLNPLQLPRRRLARLLIYVAHIGSDRFPISSHAHVFKLAVRVLPISR